MDTATIVESLAQNEVPTGEDVFLPDVSRIEFPYWWTPVDEIMRGDSMEMELTDENLTFDKRSDHWFPVLKASIRAKGFERPLRYRDGVLGNGHHRLAVAIDLGFTHVPTNPEHRSGGDYAPDGTAENNWNMRHDYRTEVVRFLGEDT